MGIAMLIVILSTWTILTNLGCSSAVANSPEATEKPQDSQDPVDVPELDLNPSEGSTGPESGRKEGVSPGE